MVRYSKWIGLFAVLLLIYASFQPWVVIPSKSITITGLDPAGTNFGKPALMNLFTSVIAALFFMLPYPMAKRANLFFCAFNVAWALRNFILFSICHAGECPQKRAGLYIVLTCSIVMMIASFFPDIKLKDEKEIDQEQP
jgi:hypothetical protein